MSWCSARLRAPGRFIFDTGASGTCISESLRDELGAEIVKTQKVRDFEGHVVPIDLVRLDSLRMGDALFRDHPVLVMPDTSLVFACLRVDGIAGCDLLRWCAVRMPNADSTITVTDDVRTLGLPRGRRMSRMELGGQVPVSAGDMPQRQTGARMYVKFDTGSAGYFHFSYADSGDAPPPLWFIDSLALGRRICVGYRLDEPQQGEQPFPGYDPPVRNSGDGHCRHAGQAHLRPQPDPRLQVVRLGAGRARFPPQALPVHTPRGEAKAPPQPRL